MCNSGVVDRCRSGLSDRRGGGPLKDVTTIQRINTRGRNTQGKCGKAGTFHPEPYSADYIFLQKT